MFCRKCGANMPEDSQFCLKCGVPVMPMFSGGPGGTAPEGAAGVDGLPEQASLNASVATTDEAASSQSWHRPLFIIGVFTLLLWAVRDVWHYGLFGAACDPLLWLLGIPLYVLYRRSKIKSALKVKDHEARNVADDLSLTSSKKLVTSSPAIPSNVAKSAVDESSSWDYAKMADEELEQLREAYQKLRVPIHSTLQSEIEKRARKDKVPEAKDSRIQDGWTEGSVRPDSHPIPNPDVGQTSAGPQATDESAEIVPERKRTSGWVILGIFLAMAFALEASFLAFRQTSDAKIVESLTKFMLYCAFAASGLLRAVSGRWLTLKRVLLIAGVSYVVGLSCLLLAFPREPAGDRYHKALLEFHSIGQQIGQIENREYHSPQDHIDALLQIDPLVRRWRQSMVGVQQSSADLRLSPPPTEAEERQFQQMLSLMNEGVSLKEQEVALAHAMQDLPPEEQHQFLDSRLMPLFRQERDLQNRALDLQKTN